MSGLDPTFAKAMKENEPRARATFLAIAYNSTPNEFSKETPDEMLVREFGPVAYLELQALGVVPIFAVPTLSLLK